MSRRALLLLALLGLAVTLLTAAFQSGPGYMDADSYYAGGRQLASGHGFNDLYLWNYLDAPKGLPHPSNSYWMPLASLLAAAGAALFGASTWPAARVGFLVVAAAIPPLTAALAWSFTKRRELAFASGLLAVFPAFYLPFLPVTDTFGLYMLLGGLFFLLLARFSLHLTRPARMFHFLLLGAISGLMHLARADGLLWLLLALSAVFFFREDGQPRLSYLFHLLFVFLGYAIIMGPWFARNVSVFGAPLAPGGMKMLWLTNYDQLFIYPASQLSFASWWHSGVAAILLARVWSLGLNLASTIGVQGEVFLLPLIALGVWQLRRDRRVQMAGLAWILTLGAMTVVFPFAGARGGFFHSGAVLQTVWWALAPLGLEQLIEWARRKRGWNALQANKVFRPAMVGLAVVLTAVIFWTRMIAGSGGAAGQAWTHEDTAYRLINSYLVSQGKTHGEIVMVANPPGFYLASGNPAVAVPYGDAQTLMAIAWNYQVTYLVLEEGSVPAGLLPVYDKPNGQNGLRFLAEIGHARIYLFIYPRKLPTLW